MADTFFPPQFKRGKFMSFSFSPYLIPPVLSIVAAYTLAAVSLLKGSNIQENRLLAIVCVWWTLLSWPFIGHLIIADTDILLKIERSVHFLYVYNPPITLLFFQKIIKKKDYRVTAAFFIISFLFSFTVWTDYYFYGFREYSWGKIAKSGPVFNIFFIYAIIFTAYLIYLFAANIHREKNRVIRLKIKYLFFSIFATAFLTMTNLPAMCGIDIYPMSNLIFIPLGILTYGLLRYHLMRLSSVVHLSIIWFMLSSMIVIPNVIIFLFLRPYFAEANAVIIFIGLIVWFRVNYTYFNRVQPLINQLFNRRSYNLSQMEKQFIKDTSLLMELDDLIPALLSMIKKALNLHDAHLFINRGNFEGYRNSDDKILRPGRATLNLFKNNNSRFEKAYLELYEQGSTGAMEIMNILEDYKCEYLIPFNNGRDVTAILLLSEKKNMKRLTDREFTFIKTISAYSAIALSNSAIYDDLRELKENLESIVLERTSTIEKQNSEIARDIELAQKIQTALLPQKIPDLDEIKIAYKYAPIMGVGGDFLDIHYRVGMSDLGLFICDVSGHGIASALIASMVKMSLNSWGKFIQNPALTFIEMKELLKGKIGNNFITACMCSINLDQGTLTVASAGHPPMILAGKDGSISQIKPRGSLILDNVNSEYKEETVKLKPGDRIVLYTDGVIEVYNKDNKLNGENFLINALKENRNLHPAELCEKIYKEITMLSGNDDSLEDDFALLIAQYR